MMPEQLHYHLTLLDGRLVDLWYWDDDWPGQAVARARRQLKAAGVPLVRYFEYGVGHGCVNEAGVSIREGTMIDLRPTFAWATTDHRIVGRGMDAHVVGGEIRHDLTVVDDPPPPNSWLLREFEGYYCGRYPTEQAATAAANARGTNVFTVEHEVMFQPGPRLRLPAPATTD